ncbi:uncharacterized protein AKAW2_60164A [Aspergillus luchuensis]|uniref:Similar to An15g06100 n=1 Tax=Aspergillus kawachii TaxID=1069201 RepID=A0A146FUC7_ASPKA|nr:uncharacterized protein AKAW2_60164A [Aspergillus luchuensis]BCS01900.1 hypothetical protein AKAW2_60164A [Aspergillus luchuensis]BCS13599.1 hypothetical protein ALUC_60155A [Aspergillus luchuensis]GAA91545.1 similar to An15g06100 [Aspergillus luchuensis IFO 4308]GAT29048.1 similar to An15g06100 [Aspergillus luchuensis]
MSFLTPIRATTLRLSRPAFAYTTTTTSPAAAAAALHTSIPRPGLKESDHNRDDLANIYEAEKHDQVKSSKEGKAKWKQEIASDSEASVKADRGEVDSDDNNFGAMQERTKGLPNRDGPVNKTQ